MELRQYMAVIWKWLWLIALATAVAAGFSYYSSRSLPRVYQTKTTLMVGRSIQSANPSTQEIWTSERLAQTYAEMTKRQPVLQGTIDALGLSTSVDGLRGQVNVNVIGGTQLMEITVLDSDPRRAKAIANEIANQLILQSPTPSELDQQEHRQFVAAQLADLQSKIEKGQEHVKELEQSLELETSAREIQDTQNQIAVLQQRVNTWQANYASLLSFYQGSDINYLAVIEPATVPTVPISPKTKLNVLLAGTVGLILAAGAAFFLEYLDDTVKTAEDAERVLSLSALGAITRIVPIREPGDHLVTVRHPKSPLSEAYRVLRTNIHFSSLDNPATTLLVTSAAPLEGKTTTLANLGITMAQAGKRVILADTDLRRPALHKIFNLPNDVGITSLLVEEADVAEALAETEVEDLRVLTSGPLPPNPSELLGSQKMEALIERLRSEADVILFDSPPLLAVTDANVLASKVAGVLIVVESGRTRSDVCRRGKEALTKVGANILGVVLNKISRRGAAGYYYYYYYYTSTGERRKKKRRWGRR